MKKVLTTLITLLLTFSLSLNSFAADEPSCKVDLDKLIWAKAEYAISGDTIIVQKQRVRLNGIIAPQIEKKQKFHTPGEPLAEESQLFLNKLLANNDLEVGIEYDETRIDNRNRQLAHVFLRDGTSIQEKILESGYALNRTSYDNTQHAKCYYQAEARARQGQYQMWDLLEKYPDLHYPLINSSELTSEDEGYRIIRGKIVEVDKSSNNYILNMDTTGIRIPKKHWHKFDYAELAQLKDQIIEVRGYAYLYKGAMYIVIDHPYAFNVFQPTNK